MLQWNNFVNFFFLQEQMAEEEEDGISLEDIQNFKANKSDLLKAVKAHRAKVRKQFADKFPEKFADKFAQ